MLAVVQYTHTTEGWSMFSPDAPIYDMMVVVDAVTRDGRHVDPGVDGLLGFQHPTKQLLEVGAPPWGDGLDQPLPAGPARAAFHLNGQIAFLGHALEQVVEVGLLQIGIERAVSAHHAVEVVARERSPEQEREQEQALVHLVTRPSPR